MNEETYREHLNDLQLEVEELRAKLKEAQTGDLISRQAAIDAICKACANGDDYVNCRDRDIKSRWCDNITALRDLPSAQPKPQWIPCSERLPENERKEYWVCTDAEYQCQCRWTNVNHFWTDLTTDWHWHWMDVPQYTEVIAWMPLPEPYAERRTDDC